MSLDDFPNVQVLSPKEKLELVDELWISIADDLDTLQVSDDEKNILDRRWAAFERNPTSALTLDQLKAQLQARLG